MKHPSEHPEAPQSGRRSPETHLIVDEGTLGALTAALDDGFSTRVRNEPARTETYYDTFDWRLHRKNAQFVCRRRRGGVRAAFTTAGVRLEGELDAAPGFARDLPPGPLRDALTPVLSVRRLMPVLRVRRRARTVRVLNEDDKTVARLGADEIEVASPEGRAKWMPVPPCWVVRPLKGYREEADAISKRLAALPGATPDPRPELDRLLESIGRRARDYSSKVRLELTGREAAGAAVRRVLANLAGTMRANEAGTLEDRDPEFLHDFRVAVRRTRSCIGQLKTTLPRETLKPFRKEFAWLGGITGPTRDLDVLLIDLDRWSDGDEAWSPLWTLVRSDQRREQKKMAGLLRSARYRGLVAGWSAFLETGPTPGEAPESDRPILEVASERIVRRYARMLARGRKLDARRATDALHRLRIDGKKLRYLLEFFRSAFPKQTVDPAIAALKRLQDNLGEFNDLQVQQATIPQLAERLERRDDVPAATFVLIGGLLERLARRERAVRREFRGEFKHFASEEFARLIG